MKLSYVYNGTVYMGIHPLRMPDDLARFPVAATEATEPAPHMVMLQNEDQIDIWLVERENYVENVNNIRSYYAAEEPWVDTSTMRMFSLTQEIVYV